MTADKHIYFASDFHLGAAGEDGKRRELKVVRWLEHVAPTAKAIYLLGDVFDFWFEYRHVVPKGYVRLLGKLAELSDAGIEIHIFTGNHDVWMFDYFPKEIGATVHTDPIEREWGGKRFVLGHGDGLGPGDHGYKFIKSIFTNRVCQRLFAMLHPYFGVKLAHFFSRKSRESTGDKDDTYLGDDKEFLVQYCESVIAERPVDYFVFGHRHLVIDKLLSNGKSRYLNLGAWFGTCHYAAYDGNELKLKTFD